MPETIITCQLEVVQCHHSEMLACETEFKPRVDCGTWMLYKFDIMLRREQTESLIVDYTRPRVDIALLLSVGSSTAVTRIPTQGEALRLLRLLVTAPKNLHIA